MGIPHGRGQFTLVNKSVYTTASVKAFVRAGMVAEGIDPTDYRVEIWNRKGDSAYPTGWGAYYCKRVGVGLPRPEKLSIDLLARMFVHELAHNRGERHHREMRYCWTDPDMNTAWADGLALRVKKPRPKVKRDCVAERRAHAREMLVDWESKARRAAKRVKHWGGKVRYYERAEGRRAAVVPRRKEDG